MTKRMLRLKRNLVLLGGATFIFPFLGSALNCTNVRNSDLLGFYQSVADNTVAAVADSTANIVGSDFNDIIIQPSAGFLTNVVNNALDRRFPDDPTFGSPFRK